jgi:predicted lipid-binding transport protein (Tim44 family)
MKRWIAMIALISLTVLPALWVADAWARAGGGSSSGSRGSRSYSAPSSSSSSSTSPSRPSPAPPSSFQQSPPQRSGWGAGIGGMLGGLVLGGLIGSLLFGGMGHMSGGIGLLEIILLAALAYFAFSFFRRRQAAIAAPAGYADPGSMGASWRPEATSRSTAVLDAPVPTAEADLARGIAHIRQMDPGFDPARFGEAASDVFFRVQAAWMARDMGSVQPALTDEMRATMQGQCDQLRAQRRVNRLENIAVRSVDVTEAWQESGQDFVTVRFLANLLDFTTDESGTQLVEGSRTEPVKFEEYWTFTRPVGPGSWRLSAIQQAGGG